MENWTKKTDEQVWGQAGEQPGSQASYWRATEQKRRLMLLQKASLETQERIAEQQLEIQRKELEIAQTMKELQASATLHAADMAKSTQRLVLFSALAVLVSVVVFLYSLFR